MFINPYLQFFAYKHLKEDLQPVAARFGMIAEELETLLPNNPQKSQMFVKLLEAKDCAVRAAFMEHPEIPEGQHQAAKLAEKTVNLPQFNLAEKTVNLPQFNVAPDINSTTIKAQTGQKE